VTAAENTQKYVGIFWYI